MYVRPKKQLGQHFLKDQQVARDIAASLLWRAPEGPSRVLEVGPGTAILTRELMRQQGMDLHMVELDRDSVAYLRQHFPDLGERLVEGDFLAHDWERHFGGEAFAIVGNFPYNISSQIFFKLLEYRDSVPQLVGMVQKEVAERLASPPGSREYGILSVLLQSYFQVEYLFTVEPWVFHPPPKVRSAVVRITSDPARTLACDPVIFKRVVKTAFNQRRKMMRGSLKSLFGDLELPQEWATQRPEQLGVADFERMTLWWQENGPPADSR